MRYVASALLNDEQINLCHEMNKSFLGALRLASSKFSDWQTVYAPEEA